MRNRLGLRKIFIDILGTAGQEQSRVYFQPPATVKMSYPCIVYAISDEDVKFANDKRYATKKRYSVTVIDKNPDSEIPDKIAEIQTAKFDRHFVTDNLNHYIYNLYY